MKVITAANFHWAPESFVSPEMVWNLINGDFHEIDVRFIPIQLLNNLLKPIWLTRAVWRSLGKELYHEYTHLPTGPRYHCFLLARSRADHFRKRSKVIFIRNIAFYVEAK